MGERETSHCRDFHPTSYQQLVRLHPRRQERQVRKFDFFAAFAPLREIFRPLVAFLPQLVFCGYKEATGESNGRTHGYLSPV